MIRVCFGHWIIVSEKSIKNKNKWLFDLILKWMKSSLSGSGRDKQDYKNRLIFISCF